MKQPFAPVQTLNRPAPADSDVDIARLYGEGLVLGRVIECLVERGEAAVDVARLTRDGQRSLPSLSLCMRPRSGLSRADIRTPYACTPGASRPVFSTYSTYDPPYVNGCG